MFAPRPIASVNTAAAVNDLCVARNRSVWRRFRIAVRVLSHRSRWRRRKLSWLEPVSHAACKIRAGYFADVMVSRPPMYGRSASGTMTEPSAC